MSQDTYNPSEKEAKDIIDEMASRGILSQTSQSSAQRGITGGVIMPEMMGGAIARRVRPGSINFVWVVDQSGSLYSYRQAMVSNMKTTLKVLREQQDDDTVDYTINLAVVAFADNVTVVLPPTPVSQVDEKVFDTYRPDGSTALNDAWMAAMVGDAGYNYQLFKQGAKAQLTVIFLLSDADENASVGFPSVPRWGGPPPREIAQMMQDLRKNRDHVFAALNFNGDRQYLLKMGFLDRNIIDLNNFSEATIADAFRKSSQAAVAISRQVSAGGNTSSDSDDDVNTMFDNAMFT